MNGFLVSYFSVSSFDEIIVIVIVVKIFSVSF